MPSLETQKQAQELRKISFCYLCGNEFVPDDDCDEDHVPPKACFATSDRNFPLKLPTHRSCNSGHKLIDEKIGQVISLKHGRLPPLSNQRLKFTFVPPSRRRAVLGAVTNVDIEGAVWRWIRGFHAALYRQPLPVTTRFAIEMPFPSAQFSGREPQFKRLRTQHLVFVETIKTNRAARNLDRIQCNNKALTYECIWDQSDTGPWICIFALDLYAWTDLGDIRNFSARGCAGSYVLPSGTVPTVATKATRLRLTLPNYEPLNPFGR